MSFLFPKEPLGGLEAAAFNATFLTLGGARAAADFFDSVDERDEAPEVADV